jgi:hypothetical protein
MGFGEASRRFDVEEWKVKLSLDWLLKEFSTDFVVIRRLRAFEALIIIFGHEASVITISFSHVHHHESLSSVPKENQLQSKEFSNCHLITHLLSQVSQLSHPKFSWLPSYDFIQPRHKYRQFYGKFTFAYKHLHAASMIWQIFLTVLSAIFERITKCEPWCRRVGGEKLWPVHSTPDIASLSYHIRDYSW